MRTIGRRVRVVHVDQMGVGMGCNGELGSERGMDAKRRVRVKS